MVSGLKRSLVALTCTVLLWLVEYSGASQLMDGAQPAILDSLTLATALELARGSHPDLRVARAGIDVARADSLFARLSSFNPDLELLFSRGGESLGSGSDGSWEIGVSQELELWGKWGARQSVATARSRTSSAELQAKLQAIESDGGNITQKLAPDFNGGASLAARR